MSPSRVVWRIWLTGSRRDDFALSGSTMKAESRLESRRMKQLEPSARAIASIRGAMKSIEVAKAMEASFSGRGSRSLSGSRRVQALPHGDRHVYIVQDLSVAREVLVSKSFSSFNCFREGIEQLEARGRPAPLLNRFFDQGLLFREGAAHRSAKQQHIRLLNQLSGELESWLPAVASFFDKRSRCIDNPLDFSRAFVRLCLGLSVSRLLSTSLPATMHALRRRENVFYYYFHPGRHQRMEAVLQQLMAAVPDDEAHCTDAEWLLAVSLLVMGYDPLIGSICAGLVDAECANLADSPARYAPTSFVPRVCIQETSLAGHELFPGDICYLSLVRCSDEDDHGSGFPFGAGVHICAGKKFSDTLLRLAGEVCDRTFPGGFTRQPIPCGDGAFLAFRPPRQVERSPLARATPDDGAGA